MMGAMHQLCLAAAILLCVVAAPADAQNNMVQRGVKAAPGKDTRVGLYTDIRPDRTTGPLPAIRLVTAPAHGVVNVKRGTLKTTNFKQCLAIEVPAFVAFYRAAEGFSGSDEFVLEVGATGGHKQLQHFRVTVSNDAGGGENL
jgi:hypothetical protein